MHFAFLTASLQTMIIQEVDMYTQNTQNLLLCAPRWPGTRHDIVSLCVAVGWFALVSGRAGRLGSLPTAPSVTLRTFVYAALLERKNVST